MQIKNFCKVVNQYEIWGDDGGHYLQMKDSRELVVERFRLGYRMKEIYYRVNKDMTLERVGDLSFYDKKTYEKENGRIKTIHKEEVEARAFGDSIRTVTYEGRDFYIIDVYFQKGLDAATEAIGRAKGWTK